MFSYDAKCFLSSMLMYKCGRICAGTTRRAEHEDGRRQNGVVNALCDSIIIAASHMCASGDVAEQNNGEAIRGGSVGGGVSVERNTSIFKKTKKQSWCTQFFSLPLRMRRTFPETPNMRMCHSERAV